MWWKWLISDFTYKDFRDQGNLWFGICEWDWMFLCHSGHECYWRIDRFLPHGKYTLCNSMHPGFAVRFMCLYESHDWLPSLIVLFQLNGCALWKNIQLKQCLLRQRSKPIYELWAAKQQTLRPRLHYRTQCPLCVRNNHPLKNFASDFDNLTMNLKWIIIYMMLPDDLDFLFVVLFQRKNNFKRTFWPTK